MAKIALLIGVSDYEGGLASLPGTQTDLLEMQRVLQKPQVGGFDVVELLQNPDPTQMQLAIEKLFQENRSRDDLILLYFSGHGVKDDNGTLHFATRITQKNQQGRVFTSTAVPASFIQGCMSNPNSHSKRQVLILDCCFSGAFANDMKAKQAEEVVDIKAQLGGEGRAVLTSSTATQVSYEKEGAGIYTRYLVQGLETGAADRNSDGHISVDELHEYAKEKVQEAAPSTQPEIYAVKEGYKILVAQAPQGDAKLTYRKELDARAKQKQGKLSPIDQRALRFRWHELGLTFKEAEQIAQEVLQPYEAFWAKLQEFEQAVKETLEYDPQMSVASLDDLRYFQQVLKLRDEDVQPILETHLKDDLSSEKGIDYTKLQDLLKAGDWKEADKENYQVMVLALGKEEEHWFTLEELLNFPCTDLKTIDRLWVKYSNGKFGFSVQKQIYLECGAEPDGNYPGDKIWNEFCDRVGWRRNSKWLSYSESEFTFCTNALAGHLPARGVMMWAWDLGAWPSGDRVSSLASRLVNCKL